MSKIKTDVSVIIADDHPVYRGGLNGILNRLPFVCKISEATDGQQVIDLLSKEHHDIVLMDVSMEPMNGIDATKIIRAKFPRTKVIALSMHDDETNILSMLDNGASGYLLKNADKDEIEEALI